MIIDENSINTFVEYCSKLKGYEKGESQLFLDRLFIAYGLGGVVEAGASCEWQLKINKITKFCDLLWPKKVLIEMKKRGSDLSKHFQQAKTYWDNTYKDRPQYVVLCNFDEFWIYDWTQQRDPVDIVPINELTWRWKSLAFLLKEPTAPLFGNSRSELTKIAAERIVAFYDCLLKRDINEYDARRFTLQCLVCMFAEDSDMYPDSTLFTSLIKDCLKGQSSYDLFTALFNQMNSTTMATGGRFKGVPYFNGGLFSRIIPIELNKDELLLLEEAAKSDWSKVEPSIFGSLFEGSLNNVERHMLGAHYTTLSEIMSIVEPTILRPWRQRINSAKTLKELETIHKELGQFKVLDPACGSGNFLYVAYRELKHIEMDLVKRIITEYPSVSAASIQSTIKCNQFYGIEVNSLGIEIAKITLSMAKKMAADEFNKITKVSRLIEFDAALPFDNLDDNFIKADALFTDWPEVDAIIGNPPYQSKNKMKVEFGTVYMNKLRTAYPYMSGRADYCVYWFRKAHDNLKPGCRAGLVGTNTITQTYSRESGLDYIVNNGGVITDAISTMPWSGEAVVYVSIVNWIKGSYDGPKKLRMNKDGKEWEEYDVKTINSSLSTSIDVSTASDLQVNKQSKACSQGQTHQGKGFLIPASEAEKMLSNNPSYSEVLFPYLIADELVGTPSSLPKRYVIDFGQRDIYSAKKYTDLFKIVETTVLPEKQKAADKEISENEALLRVKPDAKVNTDHQNALETWWQLFRPRTQLINSISLLKRYVVCGRVTKRPIFEFIDSNIHPNDALVAFPLDDDYSFGILQSDLHWMWFTSRCSTLKGDPRYTTSTVFDSFPWPQWGYDSDSLNEKECQKIIEDVAKAAKDLRLTRRKIMNDNGYSLRDLYRLTELPGDNEIKTKSDNLNKAVLRAYHACMPEDIKKLKGLELIYEINKKCAEREKMKQSVYGPGLPSFIHDKEQFVSLDYVSIMNDNNIKQNQSN